MAANTIKGLTVEIGGDTTKLGKALEEVNKKSKDLSSELGDINRLLKMDPGNAELLAQKQAVLADAVENTAKKLETLKEAERQVQDQFARGEATERQMRELEREIIAVAKKMDTYQKAAEETADELENLGRSTNDAVDGAKEIEKEAADAADNLDDLADSAAEAGRSGEGMGAKLGNAAKVGLSAVAAAAAATVAALVGAAESSREYRTEMGKLETAFTTAGHSAETATTTYRTLQGILGETEQAVEAAGHLAKLADDAEDLATWTDIATGVYATFGASLPIEGLTEAANETAKTGSLTGALADALNWAGVSEDEFQASLDECTDEQERQQLIMETLNGLYSDAAQKYRETNAEVIRANEANEAWAAVMGTVGESVEPILTDIKLMGASLISDLLPGVTNVTDAFRELLNGGEGAADGVGEALSGLISDLLNKLTELAPTVIDVGLSLITSLAATLIDGLPELVTTGVELVLALLDGLTEALPQLIAAVVDMIPQLVTALVEGIPQLLTGAIELFTALVDAIPEVTVSLIKALPDLIVAIVDALLDNIPALLDAAIELFFALVDAIPEINHELIKALPSIITAILSVLQTLPERIWEILKQVVERGGEAAKQLVETMKGRLRELPDAMLNIGRDLVQGLWNGISNMTGWIKDKLSGFASGVLDGIKGFFGIHSPSREMAWVGEMLDRGLAEGIKNAAGSPIDAMLQLSDDLLDEAGSEFDGLSLERQINASVSASAAQAQQMPGLLGKLDKILDAIERGQVLMLDGKTLIGATERQYDNALGQRRALTARGAR